MNTLVFDIGGTAIKYGLCSDGEMICSYECPTEAWKGGPHILETVCRIAEEFSAASAGSSGFQAIGISTAGQVNSEKGTIIYANSNIPDYAGTPFKETLEKRFSVPVAIENDVNSAAIGEAVYGAGREHPSFLCLTYGTGVGGAIIQDRQVYHGSSFSAGEFGGIVTHAEAKLAAKDVFDGCYERYASASALVKMVSAYDPSLTNGRMIFEHMDCPEIKAIVDGWIDEILLGLVSLTHIFNPSCILLGGGIMAQPYIISEIRSRFPKMIMSSFAHVQIHAASLGNTAGMLGACYLAEQAVKSLPPCSAQPDTSITSPN